MNFAVIKQAGLSRDEFRSLPGVGVSRPTISLWVHGKFRPHRYIEHGVQAALQSVEQALRDGRLPLPASLSKSARLAELHKRLAA